MKIKLGPRTIGEFDNGTLIKRGSQVQLFQIYDGFGLGKAILELPGLKNIHVEYEGALYKVTLARFREKAIFYNHPKFEPQYILSRRYWVKQNRNQLPLL